MSEYMTHHLLLAFPAMRRMGEQIMLELEKLEDKRFTMADAGCASFADGSPTSALPNVRGRHVYILADMQYPDPWKCCGQIIEVLDALERADVEQVTLVVPYLVFSRSDRKAKSRESIMAKRLATILETFNCLRRIITIDLHSAQVQGFYERVCVTHLTGSLLFAPFCRTWARDKSNPLVIVSPDLGAVKRTQDLQRLIGGSAKLGTLHKTRDENNESAVSKELGYMGESVEGRTVFVVDDIIDTGGTISHAAAYLMSLGASSVTILATHGILSPHKGELAEVKLVKSGAATLVSDSIPRAPDYARTYKDHIRFLSCAPLLARAIHETSNPDGSVSRIYDEARAAAKNV